jgi:hypothetical protein
MKSATSKLLYLFLGIFIGLLLAMFIFLLFSLNNRPSGFVEKLMRRDTIVDKSLASENNKNAKVPYQKKKLEVAIEKSEKDSQSRNTDAEIDSAYRYNLAEMNDIQVRKDELLNILSVPLKDLDQVTPVKTSDSLLQKFEGTPVTPEKKFYSVEFWKSPINYRGYKMIRNKIVLFGIQPSDPIELKKLENKIYLKHNQFYYPLKQTDEFDAYKAIEDELKIKQLNKK